MTLTSKDKMSRITILDWYVNRYDLFSTSPSTRCNCYVIKTALKDINAKSCTYLLIAAFFKQKCYVKFY